MSTKGLLVLGLVKAGGGFLFTDTWLCKFLQANNKTLQYSRVPQLPSTQSNMSRTLHFSALKQI